MVLLAQRVVMAVVGAAVADTASVGVGRSIVLFYSFFFKYKVNKISQSKNTIIAAVKCEMM